MIRSEVLRAMQRRCARVAIGSSAMRGAGSKGVIEAARLFLGGLDLSRFGTTSRERFDRQLNLTTQRLVRRLPPKARHWGLVRKGLNVFLRDCLYTAYLRERYRLDRAESFFEVPLDSITAKRLRATDRDLPRWRGVRHLNWRTSRAYQQAAEKLAHGWGTARVHLDAVWWGARDTSD